jgi:hypothetical protein
VTRRLRFCAAACGLAAALQPSGGFAAETRIPRSMPGDKGAYYLIEAKRDGDVVRALHKRVGVDSLVFTRTETNCRTMKMRELGNGENSIDRIRLSPTKWFDLVEGSSKSDLARFVCARP